MKLGRLETVIKDAFLTIYIAADAQIRNIPGPNYNELHVPSSIGEIHYVSWSCLLSKPNWIHGHFRAGCNGEGTIPPLPHVLQPWPILHILVDPVVVSGLFAARISLVDDETTISIRKSPMYTQLPTTKQTDLVRGSGNEPFAPPFFKK